MTMQQPYHNREDDHQESGDLARNKFVNTWLSLEKAEELIENNAGLMTNYSPDAGSYKLQLHITDARMLFDLFTENFLVFVGHPACVEYYNLVEREKYLKTSSAGDQERKFLEEIDEIRTAKKSAIYERFGDGRGGDILYSLENMEFSTIHSLIEAITECSQNAVDNTAVLDITPSELECLGNAVPLLKFLALNLKLSATKAEKVLLFLETLRCIQLRATGQTAVPY